MPLRRSHVRDPQLASPDLPGNRPISTQARVAAIDLAIDELKCRLRPVDVDMLIDYAATRYERGEIAGARGTLGMLNLNLTAVYRIEAALHTEFDERQEERA